MHRFVVGLSFVGALLLAVAPPAHGQTPVGRPVTDAYLREMRARNRQYSKAQVEAAAARLKKDEQDLGVENARTGVSRGIYMRLLEDSGLVDELLPLLEAEIERAKKQDKPFQTPDAIRLRIAQVLRIDGQIDKALAIYNDLIAEAEAAHGKNSPEALAKMQALAEAQVMMEKPAAAAELYQQIVARSRASKEKPTPTSIGYGVRLAQLLEGSGKMEAALVAYQDALARYAEVHGENTIMESVYLRQVARLNDALGRHDEAIAVSQRIVEIDTKREGADGETVQWARIGLGAALQRRGKHDEALKNYDEALAELKAKVGDDASKMLSALQNVAAGYEAADRFAAAQTLRRDAVELAQRTSGKDSPAAASALAQLALNLLQQEKWGDAEAVLRPCVAIRRQHEADNWLTFSTMSMLGGALMQQKKYEEAEPLLTEGVAGMEARADKIPDAGRIRYREAIERLVKFYQATKRPELAAPWSKKLAALPAPAP
jgi:tetratricopeptide (TPR) repeat protein